MVIHERWKRGNVALPSIDRVPGRLNELRRGQEPLPGFRSVRSISVAPRRVLARRWPLYGATTLLVTLFRSRRLVQQSIEREERTCATQVVDPTYGVEVVVQTHVRFFATCSVG
jgi:hypothetical protein